MQLPLLLTIISFQELTLAVEHFSALLFSILLVGTSVGLCHFLGFFEMLRWVAGVDREVAFASFSWPIILHSEMIVLHVSCSDRI